MNKKSKMMQKSKRNKNSKNNTKIKKTIKKKIKIQQKIENVPKTKLGTMSLFRNDLELVPKRREPQQRPLSPRYETSS